MGATYPHLPTVSNTIRYDSFLTLHLARELHERFARRGCTFAAFLRERSQFVLATGDDGIRWDLRTGIPEVGRVPLEETETLPLPRKAVISDIVALADERILRIGLTGGQRSNAVRFFIIELLPVSRNVIALDASRRIIKLLQRGTSARPLLRGQPYAPPASRERSVSGDVATWQQLLGDDPRAWRDRFIEQFAYASPINAPAIFPDQGTLADAHRRYIGLCATETQPCLLREPLGQPYPHALWQDVVMMPTLLDALRHGQAAEQPASLRLERELQRLEKKREKLTAESQSAAVEARELRARADLLMAHGHAIARGSARVELTGFAGETVALELDPTLSAIDNAQAWYAAARKRERAAERLPAMIVEVEQEIEQTRALLTRAQAGESVNLPPLKSAARRTTEGLTLPYRVYKTTGGLEVRVGRSSRANDQLTFHHSAPNDVWLHARAVGGAHVVLRWSHPTDNPPRQDLIEAALLAAQHSKARHSRTVPVDWTRRKYVRKPRGAPPGMVRLERAETVFVQLGD